MSTTPVKPVDLTSPESLAAKSWVDGIAHNNVLRDWFSFGLPKDLVECRRLLARGDGCTDHKGNDTAALLFSKNQWRTSSRRETSQLMLDYVAAGLIKVDARLVTIEDLNDFAFNGLLPLELAMTHSNADATCVLLESGAMEVTNFAGVLSDCGTGEPRPGEAFDAFARSQFASAPESLARFTEIILRRKLADLKAPAAAAATESTDGAAAVSETPAPARRRRVL